MWTLCFVRNFLLRILNVDNVYEGIVYVDNVYVDNVYLEDVYLDNVYADNVYVYNGSQRGSHQGSQTNCLRYFKMVPDEIQFHTRPYQTTLDEIIIEETILQEIISEKETIPKETFQDIFINLRKITFNTLIKKFKTIQNF